MDAMTEIPPPPPQNPYAAPVEPLNPADEKLWATLIHVGGIFFGFVPALIGYIVLRDRGPFIREHTATALNFQITATAAAIVLTITVIGIFLVWAVPILVIIFSIMAAIAANNGQLYKYPLSIPFVK